MKKLGFIVICLLLAPSLWAQYTYIEPEYCIGTNQGVALMPTVGFSPSVSQNFEVMYNGGFTFRYIGQKYFGVITELNYAQRGWSSTSATTGETYRRRLDYLEIPFLAHIYFGKEKFRFFINLGPKIRFLVNDEATAPFSVNPGKEQLKEIENILLSSEERKKRNSAKKYILGVEENVNKLDDRAAELIKTYEDATAEQLKLVRLYNSLDNDSKELIARLIVKLSEKA